MKRGCRGLWFAALVSVASVLALEARGAVVTGTVTNGSRDDQPVVRCPVRLLKFSRSTFAQVTVDSGYTNRRGRFRFRRVAVDSSSVFLVTASHEGVEYFGEIFHVLRPDTTVELAITVYDTTHAEPQVHVQMHHVFVEPDTEDYLVREVLVFHTMGNRTYISPDTGRTFLLSLPPGAYSFQVEAGIDLSQARQMGHVLLSTQPLLPGAHQVAYAYRIMREKGETVYRRPIDYPTATFSFFVSDLSIKVSSPILRREQNFAIRGREYVRLAGSDLNPGTVVEVHLSRAGLLANPTLRWAVPLALAVAVALVLLVLVRYPRVKRSQKEGADPRVRRREELLYEIAELDEAFEAGEIPEERYKARRQKLKDEVVRLTRELRSGGDSSD